MKYLVMECHRAYAIVLDSEGRFLRVANLNYEVGQELCEVFPASSQQKPSRRPILIRLSKYLAAAAGLCLFVAGIWLFAFSTYGNVYMRINPDVKVKVNRLEFVMGAEGLNSDGKALLSGYSTFGKRLPQVMEELSEKAYGEGLLRDGGRIAVKVDASDASWKKEAEDEIAAQIEAKFQGKIQVRIVPADCEDWDDFFEHDDGWTDDRTEADDKTKPTPTEEQSTKPSEIIITLPSQSLTEETKPTAKSDATEETEPSTETSPTTETSPSTETSPTTEMGRTAEVSMTETMPSETSAPETNRVEVPTESDDDTDDDIDDTDDSDTDDSYDDMDDSDVSDTDDSDDDDDDVDDNDTDDD